MSEQTTLTAQLCAAPTGPLRGRWQLYVVIVPGRVSDWPEIAVTDGGPPPTVAQRDAALADLGYERTPGAEWAWDEYSADPDNSASPVVLFASVDVRVRDSGQGGGAA